MERNVWVFAIVALVLGGIIGYSLRGGQAGQTTTSPSPTPAVASKPHEGFTLHIDAEKHFPGDEKKIAHHFCKQVSGGLTECQLYNSDSPDAKLVGVEMVVPTETWSKFDPSEQAMWHYHKEEIPKINAKLPDLSDEEAAKVVKSLEETYGKIYLLWDPSVSDQPLGNPSVHVLPR